MQIALRIVCSLVFAGEPGLLRDMREVRLRCSRDRRDASSRGAAGRCRRYGTCKTCCGLRHPLRGPPVHRDHPPVRGPLDGIDDQRAIGMTEVVERRRELPARARSRSRSARDRGRGGSGTSRARRRPARRCRAGTRPSPTRRSRSCWRCTSGSRGAGAAASAAPASGASGCRGSRSPRRARSFASEVRRATGGDVDLEAVTRCSPEANVR